MSEWIPGRHPHRLVPSVPDHHTLAVADVALLAGKVDVAGGVGQPHRDGFGEPARRTDGTEQHVGQRAATGLAQQERLQDRIDIVMPALHGHDSPVCEHHHSARRGGRHRADHSALRHRKL
jgi:hypothetical protein